jgi:mediator of RNA polymerase II transcription subunit 31
MADDDAMETVDTVSNVELPDNRFALELEFVQSLASPAYLHYLATITNNDGQSLLLDRSFRQFLIYLQKTWKEPEYSCYITFPHCFFFLDLLISNDAFCRELAQVSFRNFCHQQQFFAWQNRFSVLYGNGGKKEEDGLPGESAVQASTALAADTPAPTTY